MSPIQLSKGVPWTALSTVLVSKMILLEPAELGIPGFSLVIVASLLPVALLMRWVGVAVIATACGLAHALNHGDLTDAWIAAGSVAAATGTGLLVLRRSGNLLRWFAAGWIITGLLSISMATGQALLMGRDFSVAFLSILSGMWVTINLLGVPVAFLLNRSGYWVASRNRPRPVNALGDPP